MNTKKEELKETCLIYPNGCIKASRLKIPSISGPGKRGAVLNTFTYCRERSRKEKQVRKRLTEYYGDCANSTTVLFELQKRIDEEDPVMELEKYSIQDFVGMDIERMDEEGSYLLENSEYAAPELAYSPRTNKGRVRQMCMEKEEIKEAELVPQNCTNCSKRCDDKLCKECMQHYLKYAEVVKRREVKTNEFLTCKVCFASEGVGASSMSTCSCTLSVHSDCYNLERNSSFECDICAMNVFPVCKICSQKEGAFKNSDIGWVHFVCALFVPGCSFDDNFISLPSSNEVKCCVGEYSLTFSCP